MVISQVFCSAPCGSGTRYWVDQIQPKHFHLLGEGNKEWFSAFLLRLEIKDLNVDGLLACVYYLTSMFSFLPIYNFLRKHNLTKMTVLVWNRSGFCLKQGFVWNFVWNRAGFSAPHSHISYILPQPAPALEVPLSYPLSLLTLKLSEPNSLSLHKAVHPFVFPSLTC